jgi:SNF2 family DNA or RNA helicase/ubiquinone/menaquinone biosynthesis C-methylase UbiE
MNSMDKLINSKTESANIWRSANSLSKELELSSERIHALAVTIATESGKYAEWIQDRKSGRHIVPSYHPDLITKLFEQRIPKAGDWRSANSLKLELNSDPKNIHVQAVAIATKFDKNNEWIKDRRSHSQVAPHYHPDLIAKLVEGRVMSLGDWQTPSSLQKKLNSQPHTIHTRARAIATELGKMDEWIKDRKVFTKVTHHYHPDLVTKLFEQRVPEAGDWRSASSLSTELNSDPKNIYAQAVTIAVKFDKKNEWISERRSWNHIVPHFHPDLVTKLFEQRVPEGGDWRSASKLRHELKSVPNNIHSRAVALASEYGKSHEWIEDRHNMGKVVPHYHPDLVTKLFDQRVPESGDWRTANSIQKELKSDRVSIYNQAVTIATELGKRNEWIEDRRVRNINTPHLHPELIKLLREFYKKRFEQRGDHEEKLISNFREFIEGVANYAPNESVKDFNSLLAVFGSSRVIDLLFKFRPEFKDLPIERVKSCLAEYLGDFLSAKQEFRIKDIGAAAEFLSETTLREGLYETMKDHCLQYYFEKRRQGATGDSYEIIYNYLVHITDELHGVSNKFLDDVIEDVVSYFNSAIQEFKKPEKFVDRLSEDREFPDLNQRINMKELADKKRMLIADEMGLGKSASVIMAKENLQLGCALVIVPKIVQQTWQDYLSDDIVRKGYFKKGQAPRVLVVDGVKDLEGVSKKDFDYIIISQAKLNGRYAPLLENLDPDMLIVDESHKLKNGKGVHTNVLLPLARKLEGEGKYLAMLTGTPIPNKVNDIAVALKLLYPDQFGETPISELTATIIKGDLIDLRSLLVPRMQMKELKDVIEMPEREQKIASIPLSSAERDVYEALLELDEITAFEKMKALRTFLMNPSLVDVEPGIRSSKFEALQNKLTEAYKTKSKVLVVVNDYVTGVMRGKEFLFQQLQLPPDVSVEFIHGDDGSQSNKNIRPDLQRRFNETPEKMLLIVNGAAADVGISLVGAEETIIYNEPWTESDLMQQKARVFRQGLDHPITETTLLVRDSIEEGLHEYIAKKHKAVEKILKGIPISELEMRMIEQGEKSQDEQVSDINFEVNPEMARHYFSVKNRLLQMFAHMKQRGEESIREFLDTWGVEYAEGYRQVGARSVQANTNRVTGALIGDMIASSGRHPAALHILDVASGPEMLRRHIGDSLQVSVYSLDINKHHFEHGTLGKTYVGGWTKMPFKPHSFDYLNCAMAFQDSEFVPSKRKFERLDVLREMNRVLKTGGRAVISMIYSMEMNDMEKFRLFAEAVGFKIVSDYTGSADLEERFHSQVITLEKIADSEKTSEQVISEVGIEHRHGLKMHKTNKKLRNDRKVLAHGFFLDGKSKPILLNSRDRAVSAEETEVESEIAMLKSKYKAIKDVPIQEIIDRGYMRILVGKKYHLFRRLTKAPGIIILS